MQRLKGGGLDSSISETELLEAIEVAMKPKKIEARAVINDSLILGLRTSLPLNNPANRSLWKKDIRMAAYHNHATADAISGSSSNDTLKTFIAEAKSDASLLDQPESVQLLATEIGKKIFNFLLKPEEDLQTSCTLSDLGMDSLVAIEVRQWWKTTFEFDISVLEMMGMGTLHALGDHAAHGMRKAFHGAEK
jgi:hypothetical protein